MNRDTAGEARMKSSVTFSYRPHHMDVSVLHDREERTHDCYKIAEGFRFMLEKQEWSHQWRSPIDPITWTCQCCMTEKNVPSRGISVHAFEFS